MDDRPTELSVRLRAAPECGVGLPFFIEVTLANDTAGAEYYNLATFDPFSPPFPVEVTFIDGDRRVTLPAQSPTRGEARRGFGLSPSESRTFVLDVSELDPALEPGTWQCEAHWVMRHEDPRSPPVPVHITASDPADAPLLSHLRHAGGAREASWANLIRMPLALETTNTLRRLSEQASRALAPYLILNQAVHGFEPLAAFPPELLAPHDKGPWASEAAVLTHELLWARRAPRLAEQEAQMLARWPGLAFRVREVKAGAGLLTTLRREYGPEGGGR